MAQMESYLQVTKTEAAAYQKMKENLGFKTDKQLLDYVRVKTIDSYNPKELVVAFQ